MNNKNEKKGNIIKEYVIIGNPIGEGSFGKVYLVQHLKSKNYYAAKMLKIEKIFERPDAKRKLIRELKILMKMSHPNIARLHDIVRTQKHLYIILEYCDGDNLQDVLQTNLKLFKNGFSNRLVKHFTIQLINGLHKFYEMNVIHRDLKLGNIMLCYENFDYNNLNFKLDEHKNLQSRDINPINFIQEMKVYHTLELNKNNQTLNTYVDLKDKENFFSYKKEHFDSQDKFEEILLQSKLKIIDLGFARELEEDGAYSFCGTPCTLAPEIFHVGFSKSQNLKYDWRVDIWSLGSIVFNLMNGYPPFFSNDLLGLFKIILKGDFKISKKLKLSLEYLDFVNGLIQVNPDDRMNWDEIMSHPYITSKEKNLVHVDFEKKLLKKFCEENDSQSDNHQIFLNVFKEVDLNESSEFLILNANKKYKLLHSYNECKCRYIISPLDISCKSVADEFILNEHENYIHNDKNKIQVINKNLISGISINKVLINHQDNQKEDLIENLKNKNEDNKIQQENISDTNIEHKLDFIIVEIMYEMLENDEGYILVSYDQKEE